MGRIIAEHKKDQIRDARVAAPNALGPLLGELIIQSNVPVEIVAIMVKVSEPTVYRWMYGHCTPSPVYEPYIKKFLTILRKAKRARQLPLTGSHAQRVKQTVELVKEHRPVISH